MDTSEFIAKPTNELFYKYLIPSIFATMVTSIYVLADTIIIGKGIGATAMAALNIALPIYNIYFGLGLLFGVGGSVLMSISRGRGDIETGNAYFTLSFLLNLASWFAAQLICTVFMKDMAWFLGGTKETMPYIMDYIPYIIWGMGAYFLSAYLQTVIRNDGAPKLAMNGVIAGGIVNIILDYVFVFPLHMGMTGAALATVIGSVLTVLILLTHFFSKKNTLCFTLRGIHLHYIKEIWINGFASFLIEVSSGLTIFVFNLQLLKYVDNSAVTVFGVICNTSIVVMCLCKGINQAAQPILSINHGAGYFDRTKQVKALAMKTSLLICAIPVVVGLAAPDLFTYIFLNPDKRILALSSSAIRIYFTGFILLGVNMVFTCYFQSIAQARYSLAICLLRGCILVIAFVYLLPLFLGVIGIWMAFPAAELVTLAAGLLFTRNSSYT